MGKERGKDEKKAAKYTNKRRNDGQNPQVLFAWETSQETLAKLHLRRDDYMQLCTQS